jgi:hypothetical protein
MTKPVRLSDLFKYYKHGLPHQDAAVKMLEEKLMAAYPDLMSRDQEWFKVWSQAGKQAAPENLFLNNLVLGVPYEWQRDNKSGTGFRECFSSSAAMVAKFYGKVSNDDEYNSIRARFGDSTDAAAQLQALQYVGLRAQFKQNLGIADLERETSNGRPVLVGWLHHGSYRAPSGGGHWSVAVGTDATSVIHNDPYGMADVVNGGYKSAQGGQYIRYSKQYWLPRWQVEGANSGWGVLIQK